MYQDIGCIWWRDSLLFVKAQSLHGNGWFWSQRRLLSSCPRPLYHFLSIEEVTSGTTQQESVWLYLWHSQQPIFLVCISIWLQWFAWQDMPWLSKASRNQCFFRHCFFFSSLSLGFNVWFRRCWTVFHHRQLLIESLLKLAMRNVSLRSHRHGRRSANASLLFDGSGDKEKNVD